MSIPCINNLLVVGAGAMGSQIAMLGALAGLNVVLQDVRPEGLLKSEADLRSRLGRSVEKGRIVQDDFDNAFARLTFATDPAQGALSADLVIEAIIEDLDAKVSLFTGLSALVPDHCVFASNSSSIVGSLIGNATDRPDKFCNMHFFNPPLVMECVEIVAAEGVSAQTVAAVRDVCLRMGKKPVVLNKEIPGFVANRIINAIFREAVSLYEGGYASVEVIDEICKTALHHPMGPFELLDMAGIDVNKQMQDLFYKQSGNPDDQPQDVIVELVERNNLGRKTGRGFYTYDGDVKIGAAK
jgi:3-hydroxybutyryl-CoA dehydrogenase